MTTITGQTNIPQQAPVSPQISSTEKSQAETNVASKVGVSDSAPAPAVDTVEITGTTSGKDTQPNAASSVMQAGAQQTSSSSSMLGGLLSVVGGLVGVLTSWTGVGAAVGAGLMLVGTTISAAGDSAAQGEAQMAGQVAKGEKSGKLVDVEKVEVPTEEKKATPEKEGTPSTGATSTLSVLSEAQNSAQV